MHDLLQKRVRVSESVTPTGANGPIVLTTTGDKFIITPANPISIQRWGVILQTAKDASAMVITLETRITAGSDTGRVVSDTMTDTATARAAGITLERKIVGTNPNQSTGLDNSKVNVAALVGAGIVILPGQEAVFKVGTGAASTGAGYFYAEYIEYAAVPVIASTASTALNYTVVQL